MRKPKFKVGDKVVVWRRCQNWWISGMDHLVLHKEFVIQDMYRTDYTKLTAYVINSFNVTGDCLKLVE